MLILVPDSKKHWLELRSQDVTSTEVSALFGLNPYVSKYQLWHQKKNKEIVEIEENERMKWGNRLEPAIASGIASDNNWFIEPFKDYGRLPNLRAGSSFDFKLHINLNNPNSKSQIGLLEIKNVDGLQFKDKWVVEDGEVLEAPPHIELQCQHQLMITGYDILYIGALVGGNKVALLKRTPDVAIIAKIAKEITDFWDSIDRNNPPPPDYEVDSDFITELYSSVEEGKVIESDKDIRILAEKYHEISEHIKKLDTKKKAIKAELLTKIGTAERVTDQRFTISAGTVAAKQISFERKAFRNFRVNWRKEKK